MPVDLSSMHIISELNIRSEEEAEIIIVPLICMNPFAGCFYPLDETYSLKNLL